MSTVPACTVWIVIGTTGEYSDRDEWTVAVFLDEEEAKAHATALKETFGGLRVIHKDDGFPGFDNEAVAKEMAKFDPVFEEHNIWGDVDYFVSEAPLRIAADNTYLGSLLKVAT